MAQVGPGRPRSERARTAVLEAARDLLGDGYARLTVDGIAARAGVGRQTVYRWWPSKAAIIAEAVMSGTVPIETIVLQSSGTLRDDLRAWLLAIARATPDNIDLVLALTAAAASDPVANRELYRRVTMPDRQTIIGRLRAAAAAGELRADADIEAAADALLGSILIRVMHGDPLRESNSEGLLRLLLDGLLHAEGATPDPHR